MDITKEPLGVVIVGAGGTGGYLAEQVARLMRGMRMRDDGDGDIRLTLVDGDVVEEANLVRQNFEEDDLGTNKARALADVLGPLAGGDVTAVTSYIGGVDDLYAAAPGNGPVVVIGCVDNNATRVIIESFVASRPRTVGIDSGNTETDGQIIVWGDPDMLGYTGLHDLNSGLKPPRAPSEVFGALDTTGAEALPDDQSCELHALHAPQEMGVNMLAANGCFLILSDLVAGRALQGYMWRFDAVGPSLIRVDQ